MTIKSAKSAKAKSATGGPKPKASSSPNLPIVDDSIPNEAESFDDMHLSENILRGIYGMGYEKPALCQQKVILPFIKNKDIICQAQSGMGKTAAYCIGILQRIDVSKKYVQALVIAPTRELAEQVAEVMNALGKYMDGLRVLTCIGGTVTKYDWEGLAKGAHIVVGTCGRVANLIKARHLNPMKIKMIILDEADKMIMDYSFRPDLHFLISRVSGDAQVLLASATMPATALKRTNEFMRNPLLVLIPNEELTLQGIKQYYLGLDENAQKIDTLVEIFPSMGQKKGMIFCNTRKSAEALKEALKCKLSQSDEKLVGGMIGSMLQNARKNAMASFRSGEVNFLVASDLVGRGIDVQQVQVVVNYELPGRKEEYIHRVGRAGRFGRKGVAITLILNNEEEKKVLAELQEFYHTVIEELPSNIGDIFNV